MLSGQSWGQNNFQRKKGMSVMIKFLRNSRAATAIEYGLIAALIAVAAVGAMRGVGGKVSTTFNNVNTNMKAK
jgi:pilus assembly protein Flp/PilA